MSHPAADAATDSRPPHRAAVVADDDAGRRHHHRRHHNFHHSADRQVQVVGVVCHPLTWPRGRSGARRRRDHP